MLGLGRASEYAGWWNQNTPLIVNITAPGAVSQTVYQNPAFSFEYGNTSSGTATTSSLNSAGTIDLTGYSALSGANNNRWCMATTFRMQWPTGLAPGVDTTYNFIHDSKFHINSGLYASGFWSLTNLHRYVHQAILLLQAVLKLTTPFNVLCMNWVLMPTTTIVG